MNQKIHQKLLSWYKEFGRHDLPWRDTRNVYHVYISEIMLQQTQVSRVKEYFYPNFLSIYPTLEELAKAPIDEVLSNWSGLGYYTRARNLHKTAQLVYKEGLPKDQKELLKLPGIGKYTASAICSFALEQNVSVVDTNIARVLKRFYALKDAKEKLVWEYATKLLNKTQTRDHNLALMDLGSMICTPKNPKCEQCPLQALCKGKENPLGFSERKKVHYESLELFYGVYIKDNKIAVEKSSNKLYHGMYQLPLVDPIEEDKIGSFKHSYTKYKLTVNLYKLDELNEVKEWLDLDKLDRAPLSTLMKKALAICLQ